VREISYDRLHQTLIQDKLDNGLVVYLLPKPGFQQTFATFTTRYGSIDRTFKLQGAAEPTTVPDGIAHFLEHKMFEKEHGDVFPEFAKHGASANAFTTFDLTTYLFSCTDDVAKNTEVLLDFVQDPWFSERSVEKEKGIIGQEIRMYDDNPDWLVFFNLLQAMYKEHPVQVPIAGTVESIAKIDPDTLYQCHKTFYHPSNMVFFAVGGFEPKAMLQWIRENQAKKQFGPAPVVERIFPEEPPQVDAPEVTAKLGVSQPRCFIGWKDAKTGLTGPEQLEQEILTGVLLDALFGRSSDFYHRLIDENLIDQNFSWEYECAPTYGYSVVGGNTPNPQRLVQTVQTLLTEAQQRGVSEEDFERSRRKAIGRFITSVDNPNYVARAFVSYALRGADMFETADVLERITLEQANQRLREHFVPEQRSVSMVLPK
jgi:predicted Zn-dependent peptidase